MNIKDFAYQTPWLASSLLNPARNRSNPRPYAMLSQHGHVQAQRTHAGRGLPTGQRCPVVAGRRAPRGARHASADGTACRAAVTGAAAAVKELLEAVEGTERGVNTSPEAKDRILAAVKDLKRIGVSTRTGAFCLRSVSGRALPHAPEHRARASAPRRQRTAKAC